MSANSSRPPPPLPAAAHAAVDDDNDDPDSAMTFLRTLHPIPVFDDHVVLVRKTHRYYVDGVKLPTSVTASAQSKPFESRVEALRLFDWCRQVDADATLLESVTHYKRKQYERYRHFESVEHIMEYWVELRERGTHTHRRVERWVNHDLTFNAVRGDVAMQHYFSFVRNELAPYGMEPLRSELTMYRDFMGGQVDLLTHKPAYAQHATRKNEVWLFDWKDKQSIYINANAPRCAAPFDTLVDDGMSTYTKQLNIYRSMLEHATELRVTRMCVVLLHATNPSYRLYEVKPIEEARLETMFREHRERQLGRRAAAREQFERHANDADPLVRWSVAQRVADTHGTAAPYLPDELVALLNHSDVGIDDVLKRYCKYTTDDDNDTDDCVIVSQRDCTVHAAAADDDDIQIVQYTGTARVGSRGADDVIIVSST